MAQDCYITGFSSYTVLTTPGCVEEAHIQITFLPFRAPELMPYEDLWRQLKGVVAANRVSADIIELTERALACFDEVTMLDRLRRAGVTLAKFNGTSGYRLR